MRLRIEVVRGDYSVSRLDPASPFPGWAQGRFVSCTRTPDELSIVCETSFVPDHVQSESGWAALRVTGPIPFEMTGVASALIAPLAAVGISVFLVATFDTDYLLVKSAVLGRVIGLLRDSGHDVD